MFRQPAEIPLVETATVHDVFITGLADIDPVGGGCYRFTFVSQRENLAGDGHEQVVVARLVLPVEAIAQAMKFTACKIWRQQWEQRQTH